MYVPCTKEQFENGRSINRDVAKQIELSTRCIIKSKRYGRKRCMEDCKNCPYDKAKREGSFLSLDYLYTNNDSETFDIEIIDNAPTALEELINEEQNSKIWQEINNLCKEEQQIIILFMDGKSDSEIATILKSKKSTIQYQRTKVLNKLKEKLKKYF